MTKPMTLDGETMREMTGEEHGQWLTDRLQEQENLLIAEAKAEAKQAVLTKLGLTDDEVAALLS
jgi:hypothetical protein